MPTLPGLDKGVFKDPAPPAFDSVLSPITIPNGTTLVTTKTTNETIDNVNELIDYVSGDNGPNFIPQIAIDSLVSDLAGKEDTVNKGAVSGYAGLDASQELLLTNFPSGVALQVLRRNAGNTALEFFTLTDLQGITSINADTTAAQILAGTTNRISLIDAGATHTFDIDAAYVGQSSITTLGTITTGVWNGTAITGANINAASTDLTDSANLVRNNQANTYSGAGDQDFAASALRNFSFIESDALDVPTNGTIRLGDTQGLFWTGVGGDIASLTYDLGSGAFIISSDEAVNIAPTFHFFQSGTTPSSAHEIGRLFFISHNSVGVSASFALISGNSEDNTAGAIEGSLSLFVAENNNNTKYIGLNNATDNSIQFFRNLIMNNNDILLGTGQVTVTGGVLGDILKHDASGFSRFARGTSLQVLRVNAGGTDLEYATIAAGGDMILAAIQTVTGAKTFEDTTFFLRNVADTFSASFVNTITADRIYTLPDAAGTVVITGLASQITIGTEVTGASTALTDTADIAYLNTANTYVAGTRQDFLGLLAGTAGLNVGGIAGNPTTQVDGDVWLNTTTNQIFGRINGVDVDLGAGGGGITSINADTTAAQILAGTTNRISLIDAGATHTFDIDAAYVGQSSITTLGTITTGVWNGTAITGANINAALADLSDVTAKTGTGTIVVMDTSPTIVTPTIASFVNSQHTHQNAAGGGQLVATLALTATGTKDSTTFLRGDDTWDVPPGGGGEVFTWTADHSAARFNLENTGTIDFSLSGAISLPASTQPYMTFDDSLNPDAIVINVPAAPVELRIHFNGVEEYTFSASQLLMPNNGIFAGNIAAATTIGGIITAENTTSSPVANTIAGDIRFRGDRVGGSAFTYASIITRMADTSVADAEGELIFLIAKNSSGTLQEAITINEGESDTIHFKKAVQDFVMSSTTGAASIANLEGLIFADDTIQIGGTNSYIQRSNASLILNSPTGEDILFQINNSTELTIALNQLTTPVGTDFSVGGDLVVGDRFQGNKGPDVVGAATITLGDGNYFDITGNTNIDFMTTTGWQAGSVVVLQFDANSGANDNTGAPPANTAAFDLAGNFSASAGDTLTIVFDGTFWREISRSVN